MVQPVRFLDCEDPLQPHNVHCGQMFAATFDNVHVAVVTVAHIEHQFMPHLSMACPGKFGPGCRVKQSPSQSKLAFNLLRQRPQSQAGVRSCEQELGVN